MSESGPEAIKDLCRTCMLRVKSESSFKNRQHIYEKLVDCQESSNCSLMELLQSIAPKIKVQMTDGLPKFMCMSCIHSLRCTYDFLRMYTKSDELYRKILKDQNYGNSKHKEELLKHWKSLGINKEMNLIIKQEENVLKENLFTYDETMASEYNVMKLSEDQEEHMQRPYGEKGNSFFKQDHNHIGEEEKAAYKRYVIWYAITLQWIKILTSFLEQ